MIKVVALKVLTSLGAAILTDKFILNALVLVLEKLAASTKPTWDDELVRELKKALDMNKDKSPTLYSEVKHHKAGK